jgi:hypothetical protein
MTFVDVIQGLELTVKYITTYKEPVPKWSPRNKMVNNDINSGAPQQRKTIAVRFFFNRSTRRIHC